MVSHKDEKSLALFQMMTYLQGSSKPMAMWPESLGAPRDNMRKAGSEVSCDVIPLCIIFPSA